MNIILFYNCTVENFTFLIILYIIVRELQEFQELFSKYMYFRKGRDGFLLLEQYSLCRKRIGNLTNTFSSNSTCFYLIYYHTSARHLKIFWAASKIANMGPHRRFHRSCPFSPVKKNDFTNGDWCYSPFVLPYCYEGSSGSSRRPRPPARPETYART